MAKASAWLDGSVRQLHIALSHDLLTVSVTTWHAATEPLQEMLNYRYSMKRNSYSRTKRRRRKAEEVRPRLSCVDSRN